MPDSYYDICICEFKMRRGYNVNYCKYYKPFYLHLSGDNNLFQLKAIIQLEKRISLPAQVYTGKN